MKKQNTNHKSTDAQVRAAKLTNDNVKLARNQVGRSEKVGKKKVRPKLPRPERITGSSLVSRNKLERIVHPRLGAYFASLADPWKVTGVNCPVNFNIVPSFVTQYARTTSSDVEVGCSGGTSLNFVLFPGHGAMYTPTLASTSGLTAANVISDMDEVAYHAPLQQMASGNYYAIGPIPSHANSGVATIAPAIGVAIPTSTGMWADNSNTSSQALTYDQTLPYLAAPELSGHSRWRLTSMGIRIQNVTPMLTRGGSIVSYMPINNVQQTAVPVGAYAQLPTFKDWGPNGCEITWIPRMRDMAYWHITQSLTSSPSTPITTLMIPGISILLTAPIGNAQSYDYQIVCNWELAGDLFAPIGVPSHHMPEARSAIERLHTTLVNTQFSASGAVALGRKAVQDVQEGLGLAGKVAKAGAALSGFA